MGFLDLSFLVTGLVLIYMAEWFFEGLGAIWRQIRIWQLGAKEVEKREWEREKRRIAWAHERGERQWAEYEREQAKCQRVSDENREKERHAKALEHCAQALQSTSEACERYQRAPWAIAQAEQWRELFCAACLRAGIEPTSTNYYRVLRGEAKKLVKATGRLVG